MRLRLSDQQEAFRAEVQAFTSGLTPEPRHESTDDQFKFLVTFEQHLNDAGLAAVAWPTEYGGRGLGPVEYAIVCDELGRARAPEVINFVGIDVIAPALLVYADPEQLAAWLPRMASADEIWCQMFSEPDAGSDLTSLRTRAERTPQGWRINGQKVWSTWAQYATWGLLLARTGTQEERHRGISAFVFDMATPGIEVRSLQTMTGSAEFAEIFFDNVELPEGALMGELGHGWDVAQVMLTAERGPYAIRRSAVLRGALTGLHQLGANNTDPLTRQRIAEATIAMELLDLRIADVVTTLERNEQVGPDSALIKLLLGQVEQTIFSVALELIGPRAMAAEPEDAGTEAWVERYLYSRASTIYGGTQQIQRNLVGERILGLPR
jgi:alkylation response protein AidB-like acyl-CoA dehydrogenase